MDFNLTPDLAPNRDRGTGKNNGKKGGKERGSLIGAHSSWPRGHWTRHLQSFLGVCCRGNPQCMR
jgi:hypothetical protein